MEATKKLTFLTGDKNLSEELRRIAEKVLHEERISFQEAVYLYEHAELGYLGVLANYIRESKHGDYTYFNRNFHIEDRKSTRLNSSHVKISYAVFCLKKKKN